MRAPGPDTAVPPAGAFHIENDRRTAGRNDWRITRLGSELFQLLLDQVGALRRLVRRCKAELFERLGDARKTRSIKIGDVGGIDAHNDLLAGRDQFLDLRDVADVLLGVLRTDGHAVAAENAVAGNDLCVTLIDADGLDRAEPDAFVAVLQLACLNRRTSMGLPPFCENSLRICSFNVAQNRAGHKPRAVIRRLIQFPGKVGALRDLKPRKVRLLHRDPDVCKHRQHFSPLRAAMRRCCSSGPTERNTCRS